MAKKKIVLCDTNVFIDYFHGEERVVQELDRLGFERLAISAVSVAEIYFGMRKRETAVTRELVQKFNLFHLDKEISQSFVQLVLGYHPKGLSVPDALIAATAICYQVELFTLNRRDFEFVQGLRLYQPHF